MSNPAQGAVGAETRTAGQSLDLRDLHAANIARQAEWCPDQVPDLSFRGNELGGECGEAQNVIKKLERERQGWHGSRATKDDLADELADVVICADLCAVTADIDLGAAVRRKFNATSEKQGLSVFLPAPATRTDGGMTAGEDLRAILLRAKWIGQKTTAEDYAARVVFDTQEEAYDAYRALVALRDSATPAQPAGAVLDGLREALKPFADAAAGWDASENDGHEFSDAETIDCGDSRLTVGDLRRARTLLFTHPAGQSAGSGADTLAATLAEFQRRNGYHKREIEELLTEFGELLLSKVQPAPDSTRTGQGEDWRDDPSSDVRWNAGLVYGQDQLCRVLGVDPDKVSWDAATETLDGDVQSVICNILRAWAGDDWQALAARPAAPEAQGAWVRTGSGTANLMGGGTEQWFRASDGALQSFPYGFDPNAGRYERLTITSAPPASSGQGGR